MTDHREVARLLGVVADAFSELEQGGVKVLMRYDTVMTDFGYVMSTKDGWATRMKITDIAERPNHLGRGAQPA